MTETSQSAADQLGILEEVAEEWQSLREEGEEEGQQPFSEQLKAWYDNQLQELHDSRGDAEYQQSIVAGLQEFRQMIQQIKAYDFGLDSMDQEIAQETR